MTTVDSSFAATCHSFAHLSPDNRLHLWDVANKKERKAYVDKNHLTHSFTCYAWNNASKDKPGLFVVGFSDGIIIVWDLNRGIVSKTIGKVNESPAPTDIIFSNDGNSIFVSSNLNQITQYEVATGSVITAVKTGKKGVSKMAMNPKIGVIAACSSSIKIIDIESGRKRKLEAAFSGGVHAIRFTPCGRFLACSSARTRELLIFDVRAEATTSEPVYVLPVRGLITAIDAKTSADKESLEFLVVFEDSGACIIKLSSNYAKNESEGVNSMLQETNLVSGYPIIAGSLGNIGNRSDGGVMLAIGSKSSPVFMHVDVTTAAASSSSSVSREIQLQDIHLLADAAARSITNGKADGSASSSGSAVETLYAPSVLGPLEMGGVKRPLLATNETTTSTSDDTQKQQQKRSKGDTPVDLIVKPSKKNGAATAAAGSLGELSLEQRLEALSSSMSQLEDAADAGDAEFDATTGALVPTGNGSGSSAAAAAAPTSDSMVTLIDQALQSGDDALLEQCLACTDADIVEASAQRLSTGRIVLFLRKLVAKFEKRPSRGALLTQWLSALLRHHTAYLVTLPDLSYQLAGLSQMLEQRLGSYAKLTSLAGRLDLLMSQVSYRSSNGSSGGNSYSMQEIVPMQVYIEE